jgi:hypothetical protein
MTIQPLALALSRFRHIRFLMNLPKTDPSVSEHCGNKSVIRYSCIGTRQSGLLHAVTFLHNFTAMTVERLTPYPTAHSAAAWKDGKEFSRMESVEEPRKRSASLEDWMAA